MHIPDMRWRQKLDPTEALCYFSQQLELARRKRPRCLKMQQKFSSYEYPEDCQKSIWAKRRVMHKEEADPQNINLQLQERYELWVFFSINAFDMPDESQYGTLNKTLMLNFWYQKMIFWYQKLISDIRKSFFVIRKSISDIRKCVNFWYQRIIFGYQKINFWYQKIIYGYQKLFYDIRKCHDFLISEIVFYQKLFDDIRKCHDFLISKIIFWYIRKSWHFLIS